MEIPERGGNEKKPLALILFWTNICRKSLGITLGYAMELAESLNPSLTLIDEENSSVRYL